MIYYSIINYALKLYKMNPNKFQIHVTFHNLSDEFSQILHKYNNLPYSPRMTTCHV